MTRVGAAFRIFFRTLFNEEIAHEVEQLLHGEGKTSPALQPPELKPEPVKPSPAKPQPVTPPKPVRSEALTLLATLQRESRLIDFLKEPLEGYSDAQIGAVARDIHRDCGKVVERMFAVRPILTDAEGAAVEVPVGFDAGRYRLTGNVTGEPPFRGTLQHHGWEATQCEVPVWTGTDTASKTIAPAEVELR